MTSTFYLRKNAEVCLAEAQKAESDGARLAWLELANHWHRLAQEMEQDGAAAPPPAPIREPDAPVMQQQQQLQPKSRADEE